ncbi:MAG: DUF3885 domain-containing protein [Sedimentibacter sp.]
MYNFLYKNTLTSIYKELNKWILDYDRRQKG